MEDVIVELTKRLNAMLGLVLTLCKTCAEVLRKTVHLKIRDFAWKIQQSNSF